MAPVLPVEEAATSAVGRFMTTRGHYFVPVKTTRMMIHQASESTVLQI
jgi:hypothetical protein